MPGSRLAHFWSQTSIRAGNSWTLRRSQAWLEVHCHSRPPKRGAPMSDDGQAYKDHLPVPNKHKNAAPALSNDSPEEIEQKRAERRAKRLAEIQELNQPIDRNAKPSQLGFIPREFVSFSTIAGRRFTVMSWNILAQALVKRSLFPGCDLLKWHQRGPVLMREVVHYSPDIACMQEVDRRQDHEPELKKAGYAMDWFNGYPQKLHSLLIAWKPSVFNKVGRQHALLDDLAFTSQPDKPDGQKGRRRTGLTRVTRNVGLCLALAFGDDPSRGVIVATHHLFWHPKYSAERARQTGLWLREVRNFRRSKPVWTGWPLIFCGDFNSQPSEPSYRYLVGKALLPDHSALLQHSSVVHVTVDNLNRDACMFPFGTSRTNDLEEEGGENEAPFYAADEAGDADRWLSFRRPARAEDELLTEQEIASLYSDEATNRPLCLESAYGSHYGRLKVSHGVETFEGRPPDEGVDPAVFDGTGADEPRWTSYTPIWRHTLDYLFSLRGEGERAQKLETTGLLLLHKTAECEPGLPKKGVCASDHISIMTEYALNDAT